MTLKMGGVRSVILTKHDNLPYLFRFAGRGLSWPSSVARAKTFIFTTSKMEECEVFSYHSRIIFLPFQICMTEDRVYLGLLLLTRFAGTELSWPSSVDRVKTCWLSWPSSVDREQSYLGLLLLTGSRHVCYLGLLLLTGSRHVGTDDVHQYAAKR
ncbi:hypothetical protein V6N12_010627 [Hibiscus sabdariffa]|uniref:Uncharacterized protein n=1 Tax=Hibiscus sabdariffa TaxID=183260 RepID=A0ABR2EKZ9_9ROSI